MSLLSEMFAGNYVDATNGVTYEDFALAILAMNDKAIEELSVDDLADSLVTISAEIECEDNMGELFIARSQTTGSAASFAYRVQSDLRALFNNSDLAFAVIGADELTEVATA